MKEYLTYQELTELAYKYGVLNLNNNVHKWAIVKGFKHSTKQHFGNTIDIYYKPIHHDFTELI